MIWLFYNPVLYQQLGNKHSSKREPLWIKVLVFPMLVVAVLFSIVSNPKDAWKYYKKEFQEYYK
jgi:hypothetical protein